MLKRYKIAVVGAGYVGLSLSLLLSRDHHVSLLDIDKKKVDKINKGISPVPEKEFNQYISKYINKINLHATSNKDDALNNKDYIIIATPTDYNPDTNFFDTSSVDAVIDGISSSELKNTTIIIKSTLPVGYTKALSEEYKNLKIIFSPEFLREGSAISDNLNPSRIIIGSNSAEGKIFGEILKSISNNNDVPIIFTESSEAEAIKLFSNTYLAMRVSFFNELDSFAMSMKLNTEEIIKGVCSDERILNKYNNPSFGYGGYCLPKDTKQLLASYNEIPQSLIESIVKSNDIRKNFIAEEISKLNPKIVGIYRLLMKQGSFNNRSSAILGIIDRLKEMDMKIIIFEPNIEDGSFNEMKVLNNIQEFKEKCDLIVANRLDKKIKDVDFKVFSRDIFGIN